MLLAPFENIQDLLPGPKKSTAIEGRHFDIGGTLTAQDGTIDGTGNPVRNTHRTCIPGVSNKGPQK